MAFPSNTFKAIGHYPSATLPPTLAFVILTEFARLKSIPCTDFKRLCKDTTVQIMSTISKRDLHIKGSQMHLQDLDSSPCHSHPPQTCPVHMGAVKAFCNGANRLLHCKMPRLPSCKHAQRQWSHFPMKQAACSLTKGTPLQ